MASTKPNWREVPWKTIQNHSKLVWKNKNLEKWELLAYFLCVCDTRKCKQEIYIKTRSILPLDFQNNFPFKCKQHMQLWMVLKRKDWITSARARIHNNNQGWVHWTAQRVSVGARKPFILKTSFEMMHLT